MAYGDGMFISPLLAVMLAACSNNGGSNFDGYGGFFDVFVFDGVVEGAQVYIDQDGDGQYTAGVDVDLGLTGPGGSVSVSAQYAGQVIKADLSGSTDLYTDQTFTQGDYSAVAQADGTTILSPISTAIVAAQAEDLTADEVIEQIFGEDSGITLEDLNDVENFTAASTDVNDTDKATEISNANIELQVLLEQENHDLENFTSALLDGFDATQDLSDEALLEAQARIVEAEARAGGAPTTVSNTFTINVGDDLLLSEDDWGFRDPSGNTVAAGETEETISSEFTSLTIVSITDGTAGAAELARFEGGSGVFYGAGDTVPSDDLSSLVFVFDAANVDYSGVVEVVYTVNDGEQDSALRSLFITVLDVTPVFAGGADVALDVYENFPESTVVYQAVVSSQVPDIVYSLSGDDAADFVIDATGAVTFVASPDYEMKTSYLFTITASNGVQSASQIVTMTILDVSDSAPEFGVGTGGSVDANGDVSIDVDENVGENFEIYVASVSIAGSTRSPSYRLSGEDAASFNVDANGAITIIPNPNFEEKESYNLVLEARAGASLAVLNITINVTDLDDASVFDGANSFDVNENTSGVIFTVLAVDPEGTTVTYSLVSSPPAGFSIDSASGEVSYTGVGLDHETQDEYSLTVRAASNGHNTDQVVTVNILDANDAPVVSTPIADQNAQVGVVDTVDLSGVFSDVDAGDVLTYSVTASRTSGAGGDPLFTINAMGVLSIDASSLSGADEGDFEVTVTATDGSLSVTDSFTLAVSDDSEPVFVGAPYAFTMAENDTAETFSGTTIAATDPDGDVVTLSLVAAEGATDVPAGFLLTSGVLSYSSASGIDRESLSEDGILIVRVQAASNGLTVFQDIEITITDVDEFDVVFPQATLDAFDNLSIDENLDGSTTAVPLMTVVAADDDGDSVIAYSLTNPVAGVSIDADTGALTYTGSGFNHENTASYSFDVVATSGSKTVTQSVTLTVNDVDEGPVFDNTTDLTTASASLTLNENHGGKTFAADLTATDAEGDNITYSLSSTLTGLSINSTTGVVSYSGEHMDQDGSNPVTSYDLTVTATSNGKSATKDALLRIISVNEAPVFDSANTYNVNENTSGGIFTVNAADPEGTAVVYSLVSSPPDGFSIDSASGEVSYTGVGLDHETQDMYSLTVRAASNGQNTDQVVTVNILDVNDAPVVSAPIADYNVKIGLSQTIDITAIFSDEDGDALTYSVTVNRTSGAGGDPLVTVDAMGVLSIDASSLSGTDEGDFEVTVTATDGSLSVTDSFTLAVSDDSEPVFVGAPYAFTMAENDTAETFSGTTISATDPDGDTVTLSLVAAEGATDVPAGFVLTSGILSYSSASGIDRESLSEDGILIVRVQAASNGLTVFQDIEITITDVDEFDVVFPQATLDAFDNLSIDENLDGSTTAVPLMTVVATDDDGDSVIAYSLTNPVAGVSIDADTGALTYTGSGFNHENTDSYSFDVVATSGSKTVTKTVTLNVNDVDEGPVYCEYS